MVRSWLGVCSRLCVVRFRASSRVKSRASRWNTISFCKACCSSTSDKIGQTGCRSVRRALEASSFFNNPSCIMDTLLRTYTDAHIVATRRKERRRRRRRKREEALFWPYPPKSQFQNAKHPIERGGGGEGKSERGRPSVR